MNRKSRPFEDDFDSMDFFDDDFDTEAFIDSMEEHSVRRRRRKNAKRHIENRRQDRWLREQLADWDEYGYND